ncbi:Release factor glutamine methyltransferase, partial [Frankliniella fusca]
TAKSKQHDEEAGKKQSTLEKTSKATAKSKQHGEEAGKKQSTLEKTSKGPMQRNLDAFSPRQGSRSSARLTSTPKQISAPGATRRTGSTPKAKRSLSSSSTFNAAKKKFFKSRGEIRPSPPVSISSPDPFKFTEVYSSPKSNLKTGPKLDDIATDMWLEITVPTVQDATADYSVIAEKNADESIWERSQTVEQDSILAEEANADESVLESNITFDQDSIGAEEANVDESVLESNKTFDQDSMEAEEANADESVLESNKTFDQDSMEAEEANVDESVLESNQTVEQDSMEAEEIRTSLLPVEIMPTVSEKKSQDGSDRLTKCIYCSKTLCGSKLVRHFKRCRYLKKNNDPDVEEIFAHQRSINARGKHYNSMTKEEKEEEKNRVQKVRRLVSRIREKGDMLYNEEAWKTKGQLLVVKRPAMQVDISQYGPCPGCMKYMKFSSLAKHVRLHCRKTLETEEPEEPVKVVRRQVRMESQLLIPATAKISSDFKKNVVCNLKSGILTGIITRDPLIILRGEGLYRRHGHLPSRLQYVRCKLREMARLFFHVHGINPSIKNVEQMLCHKNFDVLVLAVDRLCGRDQQTSHYKTPSLALKLGYELNKYALLLEKQYLLKDNDDGLKNVEKFKRIMKFWSDEVSPFALRTLRHNKALKPLALPLAKDLQALHIFLKLEASKASTIIDCNDKVFGYHRLSQILMCQMVLFNRKRACEIHSIKLKSFTERKQEVHDEVLNMLSDCEKRLVDGHVTLIKTEGKNEKLVPLLLTKQHVAGVLKLLSVRDVVVDTSNEYLFANSTPSGHHNVSRALSKFCLEARLECPTNITTRSLRRHVATMAQILALGDEGKESLARFLSHSGRVHEMFYRLPEDTLLLAKTSKILFAMENGISKYAGKTLDDINIDIDSNVDEELVIECNADGTDEVNESEGNYLDSVVEEDLPEDSNFEFSVSSDDDDDYMPRNKRSTSTPASRNKLKGNRLQWTENERKVILKYFGPEIKAKTRAPTYKIKDMMRKSSCFQNKSVENIRNYINNKIRSRTLKSR